MRLTWKLIGLVRAACESVMNVLNIVDISVQRRAAATRCREKRKIWVQQLEKKADDLADTNSQLQVRPTECQSFHVPPI